MSQNGSQFLQGTVDLLILKALQAGPLHGYDVARWVRTTTDNAIEIEEGALYTALHRMRDREWIDSEWGVSKNNRRAKFYQLTTSGREELTRSTKSWRAYAEAVLRVLEAWAPGRGPTPPVRGGPDGDPATRGLSGPSPSSSPA